MAMPFRPIRRTRRVVYEAVSGLGFAEFASSVSRKSRTSSVLTPIPLWGFVNLQASSPKRGVGLSKLLQLRRIRNAHRSHIKSEKFNVRPIREITWGDAAADLGQIID